MNALIIIYALLPGALRRRRDHRHNGLRRGGEGGIGGRSDELQRHSMRSGYVTSAVEVNAPLMKIAEQTPHASLDMLRVYSRWVDLFREHSGAAFL